MRPSAMRAHVQRRAFDIDLLETQAQQRAATAPAPRAAAAGIAPIGVQQVTPASSTVGISPSLRAEIAAMRTGIPRARPA